MEKRFRAWDSVNKEMVSHEKLINDPDDWFIGLLLNEFPDDVLMQYTGLKDKNGKGIYEGDILDYTKYPDESCPYVAVFEDGAYRKKYKEWDEQVPKVVLTEREVHFLESEIIGNIYQNPELL